VRAMIAWWWWPPQQPLSYPATFSDFTTLARCGTTGSATPPLQAPQPRRLADEIQERPSQLALGVCEEPGQKSGGDVARCAVHEGTMTQVEAVDLPVAEQGCSHFLEGGRALLRDYGAAGPHQRGDL
jgi:hypothetical protein